MRNGAAAKTSDHAAPGAVDAAHGSNAGVGDYYREFGLFTALLPAAGLWLFMLVR